MSISNTTSDVVNTPVSSNVDISSTIADMVTSTLSSFVDSQPSVKTVGIAMNLHFVMSAIVGPIFCIFGLAGNVISIITWNRPGMRSSTGRYLTGLAVADLCVLLFFLVNDSFQNWWPSLKHSAAYGVFFSYIGFPMIFLSVVCSIWFTVGVTIDRYIMVCWITKAKRLCSETRANVGLLLITANSFIINLPHFAVFRPVFPTTDANGTTKPGGFEMTEFGNGQGGQFYEFWVHCILLILIPWISVLIMNIMIIKKIGKSNRRMSDKKTRQSLKKSKESEKQITRLLLTVTFTFLFFIGLQCIIQCMYMQKPAWMKAGVQQGCTLSAVIIVINWVMHPTGYWDAIDASFAFGKLGVVFNSSLNFVLYCVTGRRFRVEMLKMFGLFKKDVQLSSLMDHQSSRSSSTVTSGSGSTGSTVCEKL